MQTVKAFIIKNLVKLYLNKHVGKFIDDFYDALDAEEIKQRQHRYYAKMSSLYVNKPN